MSGIAAILHFDGRPADPQALRRMTRAMDYRGPDGIVHWTDRGAALGHCMLRTTAESLEEVQPLADESGNLHLVMDGWLANPDELRAELLALDARLRDRSDAELMLRAYQTWGADCCNHMDGEWAFLIWDAQNRRAFAARDHIGINPFHWHWNGRRLLVASDASAIIAAGDFEVRFNDSMVAEHLAFELHTAEETLWQGVMRLQPAHSMHIDANGPRVSRYWWPPRSVTLRYPREADYVDHYRELFTDSVRRASRTHLPLACEVSGGLDSSAIFAVALRELKAGRLPAPSIRGYTYSFEPGGPEDEAEYADAVAEHVGVPLVKVEPFLPDVGWFVERARADWDLPCYPNMAMAVNIGEAVRRDGARVVLNGDGGDNFLGGEAHYFAEHIMDRDWNSLVGSAREDAAELGWRRTLANIWHFGVGPLAPAPLRDARRHLGKSRRPVSQLLTPPFRELLQQRRQNHPAQPDAGPAQRTLFSRLTDPYYAYVCEYVAREAARNGHHSRSPMASRALVEFAFSSPQRLRVRGNMVKHVHREAMVGILPDKVVRRRSKATFGFAFERILDKEFEHVVNAYADYGLEKYVDSCELDVLKSQIGGLRAGMSPNNELWAVFGLEVLLRASAE